MVYVVLLVILIAGVSTLFWSLVGLGRISADRFRQVTHKTTGPHRFTPDQVAVLMPAHNEAAVIADSLTAASVLLPAHQIHVVADGCSDDTVAIARRFGVNVLDLQPNRGKAGALMAAIDHFKIPERFKVMLLLDADTRLSHDYFTTGLPGFDDPGIVAVAGRVRCQLDPPPRTLMGRLLVCYRSRVYAAVQLLVKYGQAAKWANVVSIVPGFASMYRTDILHEIDIAAPGLVIEDFNMTFEVHEKHLGRISFRPDAAIAYTQDPDSWTDYNKQVRRWTLGFWQTVRRHGFHVKGRFWFSVGLQCAELVSSSLVLLTLPFLFSFAVYTQFFLPPHIGHYELIGTLGPKYVAIGFLLPDFLLTVLATVVTRKPVFLLMAPLFSLMRFVDAWICLRMLPKAWKTESTGVWVSPTRREAIPSTAVLP